MTADDPGIVVWFTGLPASGKSTLAGRTRTLLKARGIAPVLLDSDAVRPLLAPRFGYDPEDRDAFYFRLAELAALLARQELVVLVAATAPLRSHREAARAQAPAFAEVHLDVSQEECARRDPKRLYAAARAGDAPHLPGSGAPYELPERPAIRARGGDDQEAVEAIVWLVEARHQEGRKP
jgi:adenylylsulfate kinase